MLRQTKFLQIPWLPYLGLFALFNEMATFPESVCLWHAHISLKGSICIQREKEAAYERDAYCLLFPSGNKATIATT